jgi:hypothetical protein
VCFVCLSHMVALCCWMYQEVFAQLRLQLPAPNPSPRWDVAEQAAGSDGSVGPQTASLLQEALLNVMGKPSTRELVVVDMSEKLREVGLENVMPPEASLVLLFCIAANVGGCAVLRRGLQPMRSESWPLSCAHVKSKVNVIPSLQWSCGSVFVVWACVVFLGDSCCSCRFLPAYVPESSAKDKATDRRLEPAYWMLAWDTYALAAAMMGQVCLLAHLFSVWAAGCVEVVIPRGDVAQACGDGSRDQCTRGGQEGSPRRAL